MKRFKPKNLRTATALAVIVLVCVGLAFHTGGGTPSAFGIYDIAAICPLGSIEVALASFTFVPPLLIGLLVAVILTALVGRAFCAWGCPVPLLRRILGLKSRKEKKHVHTGQQHDATAEEVEMPEKAGRSRLAATVLDIPVTRKGGVQDSRNWVLGGALLSTALFGFPVFCLICPVGLTFATIVAFWRLFQFNEVTLSLVVFPLIVVAELFIARKWCHKFCPLGAMLSLISRLNKTFVPQINASTCLRSSSSSECNRCVEACEEGIDLHVGEISAPVNECTKCGECADRCPVSAITFPLLPKKKGDRDDG